MGTNCLKSMLITVSSLLLFDYYARCESSIVLNEQVYSPNAASFGRYGNVHVSMSIGAPEIMVPLGELRARNITLPVYLTYDALGNKVNTHPGWVGLGWNLHGGGCINRIVHGDRDEFSRDEYYWKYGTGIDYDTGYMFNADQNFMNTIDATWIQNNWIVVNGMAIDREPDEFQVNLDGIRSSFYIYSEDGDIRIVSRDDVNYTAEFELSSTDHTNLYGYADAVRYRRISKIILTDKYGIKYTFGGSDYANEYNYHVESKTTQYTGEYDSQLIGHIDTWNITSIAYPDGEKICFEYERGGIPINVSKFYYREYLRDSQNNLVCDHSSNDAFGGNPENYCFTFLVPSYLRRIYSMATGDELLFEKHITQELAQPVNNYLFQSLVSTRIAGMDYNRCMSNNDYYKLNVIYGERGKVVLRYTSSETERLKLNDILYLDRQGTDTVGRYIFEYNPLKLPEYNSPHTDSWGYYSQSTIKEQQNMYYLPDSIAVKAELIRRITYPTGGTTSFEYELNRYSKVCDHYPIRLANESGLGGGVRIKKVTDFNGVEENTREYTYCLSDGFVSSGILSGKPLFKASGHASIDHLVYYPFMLHPEWQTYDYTYDLIRDIPYNSLSLTDRSHVLYSRVKETYSDESYTIYSYSTQEEYPDEYPSVSLTTYDGDALAPSYNSFELSRKLLTERVRYDAHGALVDSMLCYYSSDTSQYLKSVVNTVYVDGLMRRVDIKKHYTYYPYLKKKIMVSCPDDGGTPLVETFEYEYDSLRNLVSQKHIVGMDNEEVRTSYSGHMNTGVYASLMRTKGMTGLPIEVLRLKNGSIIKAQYIEYHEFDNGIVLPYKNYIAELDEPLPITSFTKFVGDESLKDIHYNEHEQIVLYRDSYGNPLEEYNRATGATRYQWGDDGNHLEMIGLNCGSGWIYNNGLYQRYNDIYFFDFEDMASSDGGFNSNHCVVGGFRLNVLISPNREYYCDYWLNTGDGWQYHREAYYGGVKSIGPYDGECLIDHVRVYPKDALIESYTWYHNGDIRCLVNTRGDVKTFEYDGNGRLVREKDGYGNYLVEYSYDYATSMQGEPADNVKTIKQYKQATTVSSESFCRVQKEYYDGLGRKVERQLRGAGLTGNDLVFMLEYDAVGRKKMEWLPVSLPAHDHYVPRQDIINYGIIQYSDTVLYTNTQYNGESVGRVAKEYGPGESWKNSNKCIRINYLTNRSTGDLTCNRYKICWHSDTLGLLKVYNQYEPGTLVVKKTIDEDDREKFEFRDYSGRLILERKKTGGGNSVNLDTYYLYDEMGRLECVLSPQLSSWALDNESVLMRPRGGGGQQLYDYAYLYRYDFRDNCIAKKIPGCEWIYMVYDKSGHMVASQDAIQRETDNWTVVMADALGRECIRGEGSPCYPINPFDYPLVYADCSVQRVWNGSSCQFGYSTCNVPFLLNNGPDIVKWWDDYSFRGNDGIPPVSDARITRVGIVPNESAQGLVTGMLERIFGGESNNNYLWTVNYYDGKGRLVQTSSLCLDGQSERTEMDYSFAGDVLAKTITHGVGMINGMAEHYTYTYNHWGQPLQVAHSIGESSPKLLHSYAYDGCGRVVRDTRNGNMHLDTKYKYDIRSSISEIKVGTEGETFHELLYYNAGSQLIQWGGLISRIEWRSAFDSKIRSYTYDYDGASRLSTAIYGESSFGNKRMYAYGYDRNGNITEIVRGIWLASDSNMIPVIEIRTHDGNKTVARSIASESSSYCYDKLGRLSRDDYKGICGIDYNRLGLVDSVRFVNSSLNVGYLHTASGKKLRAGEVNYDNNLVYKHGIVEKILIDDGYINISDGIYYYFVKDHLGNIRVVSGDNGIPIQVTNYGPYGDDMALSQESLPDGVMNSTDNPYKWGGKEYDDGIDVYDFESRLFDTHLFHWTAPDPASELYYGISPYAYCASNPVNIVDPTGLKWFYYAEQNECCPSWHWRDEDEYKTGAFDTNGAEVVLRGVDAVVVFNGSRSERLGVKNGKPFYLNGLGSIMASVTVYGPNGENDIHHYRGYTMSSDPEVYGAIDEGIFDGNYVTPGKRGVLSSNWVLNRGGRVRMMDGMRNPLFPNQIDRDGNGYKTGIYIHRTNRDGYAGKPVSKGCLLIHPEDWTDFNQSMSGVDSFKVQVNRSFSYPIYIFNSVKPQQLMDLQLFIWAR